MHPGIMRALPVVLVLTVFFAMGCTPKRHDAPSPRPVAQTAQSPDTSASAGSLPRADPSYLQWLERQSMLGLAPQFASHVSGTETIWHNSAAAQRLSVLLDAAPNWFNLNPYLNPYYAAPGRSVFRALAQPGFVEFLFQTGFGGLYIAPTGERGDIWLEHAQATPEGENTTSLKFDAALGDDADFEKLTGKLDELQIQMGGELPPAATGLGPDFILQARRAARFDGLYAMISVPQKDWDLLPAASAEWQCRSLQPEASAQLAQRGLLPVSLSRDALSWATPGGWGATGEVRGSDGQVRRWVYRYHHDVFRPVLLWQDPSAQAKRIFSAAAIRHTGLQRQTLAGLRLEALMGLDVVANQNTQQPPETSALTPGLEAMDDIAREIHRYGGWALQADSLPNDVTPAVLATAIDTTADTATLAAVAHAATSGDTTPLLNLLRQMSASKIDQSRLVRGINGTPVTDETRLLQLGWRIGLPGMCFISPQDLTDARSAVPWETFASRVNIHKPLTQLLQHRKRTGLAKGKLLAVLSGPSGCIAVVSTLPGGGYWLLASNFSDKKRSFSVSLPPGASGAAQDVLDGQNFSGRSFEIILDARQSRHIVSTGQPTNREGATP